MNNLITGHKSVINFQTLKGTFSLEKKKNLITYI